MLVGVGFTGSPGSLLLAGQADYYLDEKWAIGSLLQLGLSSDDTILAPTLNVKRLFDTQELGGYSWRPFAQGGIGFAYMEKDLRVGDQDDIGLLLNVGGGIEVYLDENLTLGSTIMFNSMPGKVLGDKSFLSWQVIQFQFRF